MQAKKCWKCSAFYPAEDSICPSCQSHGLAGIARKAGWILLFFCFAAGSAFFVGSKARGLPEADEAKQNRAIANSFTKVRSLLKDPGSSDFGIAKSYTADSGVTSVCGTVNAKNSFGGYTGFKRYIYESARGSVIFDAGEASFSEAWLITCR